MGRTCTPIGWHTVVAFHRRDCIRCGLLCGCLESKWRHTIPTCEHESWKCNQNRQFGHLYWVIRYARTGPAVGSHGWVRCGTHHIPDHCQLKPDPDNFWPERVPTIQDRLWPVGPKLTRVRSAVAQVYFMGQAKLKPAVVSQGWASPNSDQYRLKPNPDNFQPEWVPTIQYRLWPVDTNLVRFSPVVAQVYCWVKPNLDQP